MAPEQTSETAGVCSLENHKQRPHKAIKSSLPDFPWSDVFLTKMAILRPDEALEGPTWPQQDSEEPLEVTRVQGTSVESNPQMKNQCIIRFNLYAWPVGRCTLLHPSTPFLHLSALLLPFCHPVVCSIGYWPPTGGRRLGQVEQASVQVQPALWHFCGSVWP